MVAGHASFWQYGFINDASRFRFSAVSRPDIASSAVGACCAADEVPHHADLAGNCASVFVFILAFVVEHHYLSL